MLKLFAALAGLGLCLTGCVAPEEPDAHHASAPPEVAPAQTSQAHFEDAPVPNRRVQRGAEDQVIRLAK